MIPFISRGSVDSSSKTEISFEMPPKISHRHRMSLSLETTKTTSIVNDIRPMRTRLLTQEHLIHVHVLVRRVRQTILKKILRLQLLPVCGVQNGQQVRKLLFHLGPSHCAHFLRGTRKNEPRHKVFLEQICQFVAISARRLFSAAILIAQLLKRDFSPQPSKKHDDSIGQIQLPEPVVALPPIRKLGFDDLQVGHEMIAQGS